MAKLGKRAELLGKLLEDIDVAMLTTVGQHGYLVSRPLSTRRASWDGRRVWFFTEADSPKIGEIRRNDKVNLAYASKDKNTYVSLAGVASVNRDRVLIDRFWNDAMKAFFPKGKEDPNLVLLEVEPRTVEYWDGPSSLIGQAISFLAARVTGREELLGENRMLDLRKSPVRAKKPAAKKSAVKKTATKKSASRR